MPDLGCDDESLPDAQFESPAGQGSSNCSADSLPFGPPPASPAADGLGMTPGGSSSSRASLDFDCSDDMQSASPAADDLGTRPCGSSRASLDFDCKNDMQDEGRDAGLPLQHCGLVTAFRIGTKVVESLLTVLGRDVLNLGKLGLVGLSVFGCGFVPIIKKIW